VGGGEVGEIWLPAVDATSLTWGVYDVLVGVTEQVQLGTLDELAAMEELEVQAGILEGIQGDLAGWTPSDEQAVAYKADLEAEIAALQQTLGQLLAEEITFAEAGSLLEGDLGGLEELPRGLPEGLLTGLVWAPAIETASLTQSVYESLGEINEQLQSGALDQLAAMEELEVQAQILETIQGDLSTWTPMDEQLIAYKADLEAQVAALQAAVDQLLLGETPLPELQGLLEEDLSDIDELTQGIFDAATIEGLDMGQMQSVLEDLSKSIEETLDIQVVLPLP
jgi:hypothetical protein